MQLLPGPCSPPALDLGLLQAQAHPCCSTVLQACACPLLHRDASALPMSQLQKALENLMLTDPELYTKLQGSLRGIGTPARETNQLQVRCAGADWRYAVSTMVEMLVLCASVQWPCSIGAGAAASSAWCSVSGLGCRRCVSVYMLADAWAVSVLVDAAGARQDRRHRDQPVRGGQDAGQGRLWQGQAVPQHSGQPAVRHQGRRLPGCFIGTCPCAAPRRE
jgi:hypothetical protein